MSKIYNNFVYVLNDDVLVWMGKVVTGRGNQFEARLTHCADYFVQTGLASSQAAHFTATNSIVEVTWLAIAPSIL